MASATRTTRFAFTTRTTSLSAATRYDFTQITLYSPENTTRTFRSVMVVVHAQRADNNSITSALVGIKLGATAFSDSTVTDTYQSGANYTWKRDVTSYFTTNFGTGTSQTCQVGVNFGGAATINISVELIITYEYDTTDTTRIKTVMIPIESITGPLTATLAELGTNQVPNLSTFCPEASKTFRDIYFLIEVNEGRDGATSAALGLSLDSEGEAAFGACDTTVTESSYCRFIWKRTDMTTNATHAFKARTSSTDAGFDCIGAVLVVTYEYNHSTSSTILNSLQMAVGDPLMTGGATSANQSRKRLKFFIEEPTTITLAQSGILVSGNMQVDDATAFRCGSQSYRTYQKEAGSSTRGSHHFVHRIDSGGAQGAGVSIARGENTLTVDWYSTNGVTNLGRLNSVTSLLYLNYTSGKATGGDNTHNHTTYWGLNYSAADVQTAIDILSAAGVNIPETSFWLTNVGMWITHVADGSNLSGFFLVEQLTGEGDEDGFRPMTYWVNDTDADDGTHVQFMGVPGQWLRHPSDPDDFRMNIESTRDYRLHSNGTIFRSDVTRMVTYHSITFTAAGSVTGYSGDGSGITVEIRRADTDEKLYSDTTAVGGGYSATVYDDTIDLTADARQSATKVGRSDDYKAS